MIKLSIKNQEEPEVEEEFKGILYLEQDGSGNIDLRLETPDGKKFFIVSLYTDGTLQKHPCLPRNIGLQVDDDGRILESEE